MAQSGSKNKQKHKEHNKLASLLSYSFFIIFQQACTTLNVDIITIDVTENLDYRFKRQTINKVYSVVQSGTVL